MACEDLVKVNCREQEEPAIAIGQEWHTCIWFTTISPPRRLLPTTYNSAIIDTVYLPGVATSSSSPNISLSIFIDTLHRTSHL